VIKVLEPEDQTLKFSSVYTDEAFGEETGVRYYYLRITQTNNHIGWSGPVWVV
jgi:hypothetical protein